MSHASAPLRKPVLALLYVAYLVGIVVLFDVVVLHHLLGFGYPRHYSQENIERYPAPYVEFIGKPGAKDHNAAGFRGPALDQARPGDLRIAFFGGSTGYLGEPPIPARLGQELEKLTGQGVFVANYSVVSSNHRQHLHGIIEFLPQVEPDIVVFYGGYNETVQSGTYDPRPGYPFNHFYRAETAPWVKVAMENSAILGEIDKKTGYFTGLGKLRDQEQPFSDRWNGRIVDKYFETLERARRVTGTLTSAKFGQARFYAFYQPYQVPANFQAGHRAIRDRIPSLPYLHDVSAEYDRLGPEVYTDIVHVRQAGNDAMGARIAGLLAGHLRTDAAPATRPPAGNP